MPKNDDRSPISDREAVTRLFIAHLEKKYPGTRWTPRVEPKDEPTGKPETDK